MNVWVTAEINGPYRREEGRPGAGRVGGEKERGHSWLGNQFELVVAKGMVCLGPWCHSVSQSQLIPYCMAVVLLSPTMLALAPSLLPLSPSFSRGPRSHQVRAPPRPATETTNQPVLMVAIEPLMVMG